MIASGARRHPHLQQPAWGSSALAVLAIAVTLLLWAAFTARPASTPEVPVGPTVVASKVRSVAYSIPSDGFDRIYIRPADGDTVRRVAEFRYFLNFHARGSASPAGDRLAVLHLADGPATGARLTLVSLPGGEQLPTAGSFDYLSPLVWSPAGSQVAGVQTSPADEAGRVRASIIETDTRLGSPRLAAQFDAVLQAAPVGYSFDGRRLFVVVVDQSGSTLWAIEGARVQRIAPMSPGRTRDWSLSPDGARLAFVEVAGAGERSYVGRTLTIATGAIRGAGPGGDQYGPAWLPGSDVPVFGGPGGSVQLTSPSAAPAVVIPSRWSPDGTSLVASIYPAAGDRSADPTRSIELVSASRRVRLSSDEDAWFYGWVRDID